MECPSPTYQVQTSSRPPLQNQVDKREGHVNTALAELEMNCTILKEGMSSLFSRLNPVLSVPPGGDERGKEPMPVVPVIAERIISVNRQIREVNEVISYLLQNLEI